MTPREGLLEQARPLAPSGREAPQVEIVVPVRNEERDLGPSVRRIEAYLRTSFPFTARITIADNGSTDGTWAIALALASELDLVRAVRLEQPGRGRALRSIWLAGRRGRARLHGCRFVDRLERPAPAGRAAALRPQRRGHRNQAGPRRPGSPRPAARGHLPWLQPAAARPSAPGSPTRSADSRRSAGPGHGCCCR
jgi:cellulose synthase/poly-beta-1,6-N-acetylglucosamine synthase-like glycosyltransferase